MTQYAETLKRTGEVSGNGVNMRDLARLLKLYRLYVSQGDRSQVALATALRICYSEELLKGPAQRHDLLTEPNLDQIPKASLIRLNNQSVTMSLGGISPCAQTYQRITQLTSE